MTNGSPKRMLITGISGLLGSNLAHCLKEKYDILGLYLTHPVTIDRVRTARVDLCSLDETRRCFDEFKPDVVVHSAAISDVDQCERDHTIAEKVNIGATENVVAALEASGAKLVYVSTDCVYDGQKGNFRENDTPNPHNFYGITKYQGECAALKRAGTVAARTNFFGWNVQEKLSLAEWIVSKLKAGEEIGGFTDVICSTIYTFDIADILDDVLEKNLSGIYNFAGSSAETKHDIAIGLAGLLGLDKSLIKPISVDEFPFAARRGKNLAMDTTKLQRDLGRRVPTVRQALERFCADAREGLQDNIKRGFVHQRGGE